MGGDPAPVHRAHAIAAERRRIPALDGLRGVAVLAVVACHATLAWAPPGGMPRVLAAPVAVGLRVLGFGWAGVDLFFALSGFLITRILLDTRGRAGYFRTFYARRVRRIWPVYLAALAGVTGVAWATHAAAWWPAFPWAAVHALNWRMAHGLTAAEAPLGTGHLWSLGVEEQWYLAWPLVVSVVAPARLGRWCVGLALTSALARAAALAAYGAPAMFATFVLPVTHAEGLALGAWLAWAARTPAVWARVRTAGAWLRGARGVGPVALVAGAVAVGWVARGATMYDAPGRQTLAAPLVALAAVLAVALTLTAPPGGRWAAALARPSLRAVGRVSYGWYVFHGFAMVASDTWLSAGDGRVTATMLAGRLAAAGGSFALAAASWRWVERPILEGAALRQSETIAASTAAVA